MTFDLAPNIAQVLTKLLPQASKFYGAIALVKDYGVSLIKQLPADCEIKVLLGVDLPTPHKVFLDLAAIKNVTLKVYEETNINYHPKVYLIEVEKKWHAFVGSANFTQGGFESNIEMTAHFDDGKQIDFLLEWFNKLFTTSTVVDEVWLAAYDAYCKEREELDTKRRVLLKGFKGRRIKANPISGYNFQGQFFQFVHHDAFSGSKPWDRSKIIVKERIKAADRLYELHKTVFPLIKKKNWNIEPHYVEEHIISSTEHGEYTRDELDAIWLSYNRPEKEVKKLISLFGETQTPLYQMRLQVLLRVDNVAVHLTVGKDGGGWRERDQIAKMLHDESDVRVLTFHKLLKDLSNSFYIEIAKVPVQANSFKEKDDLRKHLAKDNIATYYFIIGTKYRPDDKRISSASIANTVMSDFEQLIPIYKFLTVPVPK